MKNKTWLNVASSTFVEKEYINLDNHIFLRYLNLFSFFSFLLNKEHKEYVKKFSEAKKNTILRVHDCRKKLDFTDNSVDHILCSHFLEHIFPQEAKTVLNDFYRVLKKGGTLHIIVPDINEYVQKYIFESKDPNLKDQAADKLIESTILSRKYRGNFRFRLLEFFGGFGLNHRWMYDFNSMKKMITGSNFLIVDDLNIPSKNYRKDDGSVHVFARKG